MERYNGVELDPEGAFVYYDDAQRALDAEREKVKELEANQAEYEKCTDEQIQALNKGCLDYEKQLATLQARCAHLDVLLRDEYLPKLDVVAVQRSIADRDSRIDALEREVEKLDDDKETLQAQLTRLEEEYAEKCIAKDNYITTLIEAKNKAKAQLAGLKRNAGLDCGDQSCLYAVEHTGMRTNGGCRCDPKRMKDDLVRSRKACDALQAQLRHMTKERDIQKEVADNQAWHVRQLRQAIEHVHKAWAAKTPHEFHAWFAQNVALARAAQIEEGEDLK